MSAGRRLLDDCFLHDRDRMRHSEVLALISERLSPIVPTELVPLREAAGRILAEQIAAPRDVPFSDNSAVDGYAFAYADYFKRNTLGIRTRIAAGDLAPVEIGKGEAARIFTGAAMPTGADTVAMQEDCELSEDGSTVTVPKGLKPGANRRRAGEDVAQGSIAIEPCVRLRAQDLAAIASFGFDQVPVYRRLRIAVLSTGNELVEPGSADPFQPGLVFDSNRTMLAALAETLPIEITDLGILKDDASLIARTIEDAAGKHDVILSTGGASRGEEDHVVTTLDSLGKRHLWQIAVKPGRPMVVGQIPTDQGDCVFFGLPGNPVAVLVCFLLYVRPALTILGGGQALEPVRYQLPAAFHIARKKTDRREFLRGWLAIGPDGITRIEKFPRDGSGLITGLRQATGLIELDEAVNEVREGDRVAFIPFNEFGL
ncbi:molybdopterin molybdenumtransferase MoeA [Georhizobium profundi]|uniref:Molybdopterin molybdenumtransferase n=1 Tax=Georhizobium profundi TaxID=2341112 RepID=A0A3Q8XNL9_9HYPH|nr:gephyrin-like molybdotransferase Glp [Georhizobium profundi]AZN71684.1 molybdopterin molybdenumtransferase MoeA [Georhizobium profundi]